MIYSESLSNQTDKITFRTKNTFSAGLTLVHYYPSTFIGENVTLYVPKQFQQLLKTNKLELVPWIYKTKLQEKKFQADICFPGLQQGRLQKR